MENGFIYLIKASGLIGLFYFAYFLLLRKETFFSANRWFLLLGLITSSVLPLFFITKIIWVEPITESLDWSNIPVTTSVTAPEPEINWYLVLACVYFTGIVISFVKLVFDFNSVIQLLRGKTMQQQSSFKLIDIAENIAPFSYFNYIVYNSSLYTAVELENILEHEKVHSQQKHSVDVLFSRLFCVVFWFNPLIWLYKKAIAQNLEFIADNEAAKKITDKKVYQFTLLKITTQENCVALTNHFYQSLIKKRIIMLNQNQSKKWNLWKYSLVFPALVAFVFLFQIEVVAQEKQTPKQETETKSESIDLKSFEVDKDLISLSEGKEIYIDGKKSSQEELDKLDPDEIEGVDVAKISGKKTILVTTKNNTNKISKMIKLTDKTIYINDIKSTDEEFSKLDKNNIDKIDVNTFENTVRLTAKNEKPFVIVDGIEQKHNFKVEDIPTYQIAQINILKGISAITKYGEKAGNGVIEITTKENNEKKELESSNDVKVIGFKIAQDKEIYGWKNKATDSMDTKQIITTPNTDINNVLIIIDGKKTKKTIKDLDQKNIESINVLKGKKAEDKYGIEGKDGVVEIKTKQSKK